jgi:hypothetical protein
MIRSKFKKSEDELLDEKLGRAALKIPIDCLKRNQREVLASLLLQRIQSVDATVGIQASQWKLVLAVLTKLMRRSTFCEVSLHIYQGFRHKHGGP